VRALRAGSGHAVTVVLGYSCVYLLFFGVALLGGRVLAPGDAFIQSFPNYLLPQTGWTALLYSGYAIQADPQAMMWYPPKLILSAIPQSWNAFLILAYLMASSFCYGYVHRITGSRLAAAIAGLVFGLNSFLIAHLGHTNLIHSVAWVPLVFWALEELWRGGGPVWGVVASLAVANCLLAGHPQIFAYGMTLAVSYWVCLEVWQRNLRQGERSQRSNSQARRRVLVVASLGLGVGLAGVLLLPMLELAGESTRNELSYRYFVSGSLRLLQLPQLVFPYIWGGWQVPLFGEPPLGFFARGNPSETRVFAGVVPLVLAAVAIAGRKNSKRTWFWIFVAGLGLLFALGRQLHVVAPLYLVPGFNRFRIPARHLMEFHLALSVLCGLGVAALQRLERSPARAALWRSARWVAGLALLSLVLVVAVLLSGYWEQARVAAGVTRADAWPWRNPTLVLQLAAVTLGAAALWHWSRVRSTSAAFWLCAAIVIDLGCYGWIAAWRASPTSEAMVRMPPALQSVREELRQSGQRLLTLGVAPPDESAPPNRNLLWDIPNASGYGPLVSRRYSEFARVGPYGVEDLAVLSGEDRALDLLAIRYLLVPASQAEEARPYLEASLASTRWRQVAENGGTVRYENLRAMPRAWLVGEVLTLEPEAVLASVRGARLPNGDPFEPHRIALVEEATGGPEGPNEASCASDCGTVELSVVEAERLQLRVRANQRAYLVVSDVFYPGWVARLDGQPAPLYRSDYALRGLWVPAGESDVELAFESSSIALGSVLSGGCALVLVAGALASRWRGFR